MSRKKAREIAVHILFQHSFCKDEMTNERLDAYLDAKVHTMLADDVPVYAGTLNKGQETYVRAVVLGVCAQKTALDKQIAGNLHGWSISRLSRMTMALLRLAIFEMQSVDDVPTGVAINEAIELAKTYEGEESGAFINGVLGALTRGDNAEAIAKAAEAEAQAAIAQAAAAAELEALLASEVGEVDEMDIDQAADAIHKIMTAPATVQEQALLETLAPTMAEEAAQAMAEVLAEAPMAMAFDLDDDEEVECAPVQQ